LKVVSSSTLLWWCLGCPWFGLVEGGGAAPLFWWFIFFSCLFPLVCGGVCVSHLSVVVFVSVCLLVLLLVSSAVCFGCCVVVMFVCCVVVVC